MSHLSPAALTIVVFTPLAAAIILFAGIAWMWLRRPRAPLDAPKLLLEWLIPCMPEHRREWGGAMLAELDQVRGRAARWRFGLGCARTALFPPRMREWPRCWFFALRALDPKCGVLSVLLPPLGLPLLCAAALAAERFTTHDDFFNGELVPGMIGVFIFGSVACMLSGLPLGLAGLIRREQLRWLSAIGPVFSLLIFGYLQLVQHVAQQLN